MSEPPRIVLELREAQMEEIAPRAAVLARMGFAPAAALAYLTIPEAAAYLRCKRQRVDDLLSQPRLRRVMDGGRTLIGRCGLAERFTHPAHRRRPWRCGCPRDAPARGRRRRVEPGDVLASPRLPACDVAAGSGGVVITRADESQESPRTIS